MMTDPIADLLTRIRNALMARHTHAVVRFSKIGVYIVEILKQNGFIMDYAVLKDGLTIALKYDENNIPVIVGILRVSKPGCRRYSKKKQIPKIQAGFGISIISTSLGVMSSNDARRRGVGGEIICSVW